MEWLRFIAVIFVFNFAQFKCTKLNFPRILLPVFNELHINFTIEVSEKGCFKWSTSRVDLIHLTPIYDSKLDCTYKVIVTTISTEKHRNTAVVLAEDLSNGEILRCDVILDVIHDLGVLTTTRELYLEEAPETFELWAQDSQGNAFTTLEGIEFNWEITTQKYRNVDNTHEINTWDHVLRFISFSESKYHETPKSLDTFEQLGRRGYMVLLEGINSGTAQVKVNLPYKEYEHVAGVTVNIFVLANLLLDPLDVNILIGDQVTFKVLQLKQGKLEEISLSNQYYLEIEDTNKANIGGNIVTGKSLGKTYVVLKDHNVPDEQYSKIHKNGSPLPKASITVVLPYKLSLSLLPHFNWLTVVNEQHTIVIDLYTKNDQKITLGQNYKFDCSFSETIFKKEGENSQGNNIIGIAIKEGVTTVNAYFKKFNLSASTDLRVLNELELTPEKIILPFSIATNQRQEIQFFASGGDGIYTWSTLNTKLLLISQTGLAETQYENFEILSENSYITQSLQAVTSVIVSLTRNKNIKKKAEVFFYPPEKLKILKYNFETSVGDYVILHIAIYSQINGSLVAYTACDTVNLDIEFSNKKIFNLNMESSQKSEIKDACKKIYLKAIASGTTNLKVSYRFSGKVFSDEVFLAAFNTLTIINPYENEIVLPIGASRNVFYKNGPQKLINFEAELIKRVTYDKEYISVFEVESKASENTIIYKVLCKKIGELEISIDIYNELNTPVTVPYVKSHITKVFCAKPRFLSLYTLENLKTECPLKTKDSQLYLKTTNDIKIEVEITDAQKRKLQNITSIDIAWQFVQNDGRSIVENIKFDQQEDFEIFEGAAVPKQNYLTLKINEVYSVIKIKGIVTQYNVKTLDYYMIEPEKPNFGVSKPLSDKLVKPVIENELHILSVEKTLLALTSISIFLPLKKAERVKLTQGSGFYKINDSPTEIVDLKYGEKSRELVIFPLKVGQTSVTIEDQCLPLEPTTVIVSVVVIGKIEIKSLNRVEKTKSIETLVKIYDSNGNLIKIDNNNVESYRIKLDTVEPNILGIKLGHQQNLNDGEIRYILTGLELGETKIIASSTIQNSENENERVVSTSLSIQVFPPLTITPKNITLYEGSSIQLYSKGGPYPDVNVIYIVKNNQIALINSTVVHGLKVGHTQIIGKCVDKNDISSDQVKYSEDYVNVYVIPFDGIKIRTPLLRLKSGSIMPATIWGLPNISPLVLGTLSSLEVNWSTNQPKIIEIKRVFSQLRENEKTTISVRINALTSGKAQLQAIVSANDRKFTANVEIIVFKMLELEIPKKISYDPIILPPMASVHLKTNLNDAVYMLDQQNNSVIQVTREGIVTSMENNGRSEVIASSVDQTLLIPIEVKNVHYILVQPYETQLKNVEQHIPNGLNIGMRVSLHDNMGNEFATTSEDNHAISHRLANKDTVDVHFIEHFSFKVKFLNTSSNVLYIYLKDQNGVKYPDDYIQLSVNESMTLFPKQIEFSVGDIICFDSPLAGSLKWHSQDTDSILVHAETGVAHVRTAKNSEISIKHGGNSQYSYFEFGLFVKELDKIEFLKKIDIFNGERYFGKLVLKNHLQSEKYMNVFSKNLSECLNKVQTGSTVDFFTCDLSIEQHSFRHVLKSFRISATFDIKTGTYGCVIDTIELHGDIKNIIKSTEMNLILEARLPNGIKDIATLKFVPAISISPEIISIEQLEKKLITITGMEKVIKKVEVLSSHPSDLEITLSSKTEYTRNYRARLLKLNDEVTNMHIIVKSMMTHQYIEIPIVFSNYIQKCSSQPMTYFSNLLISLISNVGSFVTALVLIGVVAWILQSWQQMHKKVNNISPFKTNQFSSLPLNKSMNLSNINNSSLFQTTSPYQTKDTITNTSASPVYGDTALFSPQKRTYRRLL